MKHFLLALTILLSGPALAEPEQMQEDAVNLPLFETFPPVSEVCQFSDAACVKAETKARISVDQSLRFAWSADDKRLIQLCVLEHFLARPDKRGWSTFYRARVSCMNQNSPPG